MAWQVCWYSERNLVVNLLSTTWANQSFARIKNNWPRYRKPTINFLKTSQGIINSPPHWILICPQCQGFSLYGAYCKKRFVKVTSSKIKATVFGDSLYVLSFYKLKDVLFYTPHNIFQRKNICMQINIFSMSRFIPYWGGDTLGIIW